jgi:hypothetical protein
VSAERELAGLRVHELDQTLTWIGRSGPDYEFTAAFLNVCNGILGYRSRSPSK